MLRVNKNIPEMSHGYIMVFLTENISFLYCIFILPSVLLKWFSGMHANMGIMLKETCLAFVNISKKLKKITVTCQFAFECSEPKLENPTPGETPFSTVVKSNVIVITAFVCFFFFTEKKPFLELRPFLDF